MILKTSITMVILLQAALLGYILYDYDTFIRDYNDSRMAIARAKSELRESQANIKSLEVEKKLMGMTIPEKYVKKYIKHHKAILLIATSQDCSPCTEAELQIWKKFLDQNNFAEQTLCIYHRFHENSVGKHESVYKSVFPFTYDQEGLYEFIAITDTPVALLVNDEGEVLYAHRPDVVNTEKTEKFIDAILKVI